MQSFFFRCPFLSSSPGLSKAFAPRPAQQLRRVAPARCDYHIENPTFFIFFFLEGINLHTDHLPHALLAALWDPLGFFYYLRLSRVGG